MINGAKKLVHEKSEDETNHTDTNALPLLVQNILLSHDTLIKTIAPAIINHIKQSFDITPQYETNILKLFSHSLKEVATLEKETQEHQKVFNETSLKASNIQHCLTIWYYFTTLIEKYKKLDGYKDLKSSEKTNTLFDYFSTSILLSIKYNTDEVYWNQNFSLLYSQLFQEQAKQEKLNSFRNNIEQLIKQFIAIKRNPSSGSKYLITILDDLDDINYIIYIYQNWERYISSNSFDTIHKLCLHCQSIYENLNQHPILQLLIQEDHIKQFQYQLEKTHTDFRQYLMPVFENQKKFTDLEKKCLMSLDWKLSGPDMWSDEQRYQLIKKIEADAFSYLVGRLKLAEKTTEQSTPYLPQLTAEQAKLKPPVDSEKNIESKHIELQSQACLKHSRKRK